MILVVGYHGTLGSVLMRHHDARPYMFRLEDEPQIHAQYDAAILCAGRKGFHECEGDAKAFRADVDGNIRLIKALQKRGVFVLFVSTEAVERIGHGAAYSRNRLLVEQFLWGREDCAIIRPGRFDKDSAPELADKCFYIIEGKLEGIHHWP